MKKKALIIHTGIYLVGILFIFSADPPPLLALQTHGGLEGLYVHQGAHLFLIISLIIFLINVHRSSLELKKAWRLLYWGAFLFVFWNIWACIGHVVEILVPESLFVTLPGRIVPSLGINSWQEVAYYILKMDHLFCLPALMFFYAGLRKAQSLLYQEDDEKKRRLS